MDRQQLEDIKDKIIDAVQREDYRQARELIDTLGKLAINGERYDELIAEQKERNKELEEKLRELQMPPLSSCVVLGASPDDDENVVVGSGGQRLEVRIAVDADLKPQDIAPASEAWLNEDRQIVKVRATHSSGEMAQISSLLEDGRIEVACRGHEELVVQPLFDLADQELEIGDRICIDPQLAVAFEKLPQTTNQDLELDAIPDVAYSDIGGLDQHIEEIREAIELPYIHYQLYKRYRLQRPKGILLYGPPGCGKTMIAKAIANGLTAEVTRNLELVVDSLEWLTELSSPGEQEKAELVDRYIEWQHSIGRPEPAVGDQVPVPERQEIYQDLAEFLSSRNVDVDGDVAEELERVRARLAEGSQAYFMSIKGPELLNKYVGETEHTIRKLFLQAKRKASPSTPVIMFFDEIEALFRRRGSRLSSDMESTVVPQFLSEIDGVEELNDVIIIGATNRQDLLDPAILRPGRLDTKIKIERPNEEATRAIFGKYLIPELPIAAGEIKEGLTAEEVLEAMIDQATGMLYDDGSVIQVSGQEVDGGKKTLHCRDLISGAMIESVVSRAKKRALKEEIESGSGGLGWNLLREAILEEVEQNKDALIATTLNLSEEGLSIEVCMQVGDLMSGNRWLQPARRLWARPAADL